MEQQKNSPLENMSQTQMFGLGAVAGVLVLCTIGFFILLGVLLNGGGLNLGTLNSEKVAVDDGTGDPIPSAPTGQAPAAQPAPAVDSKEDHIRGNVNAKVTLLVYSDFECPFCGRFVPSLEQAAKEYGDKIRIVFRHFPLSFHQQAMPAALASECASEQGKFWEFHDEMFKNQTSLSDKLYKDTATKLGLNMTKFNDCVSSAKYNTKIQNQMSGGSAAGVGGTPHTIVSGPKGTTPVSGAQPFASLKAAIDSVL